MYRIRFNFFRLVACLRSSLPIIPYISQQHLNKRKINPENVETKYNTINISVCYEVVEASIDAKTILDTECGLQTQDRFDNIKDRTKLENELSNQCDVAESGISESCCSYPYVVLNRDFIEIPTSEMDPNYLNSGIGYELSSTESMDSEIKLGNDRFKERYFKMNISTESYVKVIEDQVKMKEHESNNSDFKNKSQSDINKLESIDGVKTANSSNNCMNDFELDSFIELKTGNVISNETEIKNFNSESPNSSVNCIINALEHASCTQNEQNMNFEEFNVMCDTDGANDYAILDTGNRESSELSKDEIEAYCPNNRANLLDDRSSKRNALKTAASLNASMDEFMIISDVKDLYKEVKYSETFAPTSNECNAKDAVSILKHQCEHKSINLNKNNLITPCSNTFTKVENIRTLADTPNICNSSDACLKSFEETESSVVSGEELKTSQTHSKTCDHSRNLEVTSILSRNFCKNMNEDEIYSTLIKTEISLSDSSGKLDPLHTQIHDAQSVKQVHLEDSTERFQNAESLNQWTSESLTTDSEHYSTNSDLLTESSALKCKTLGNQNLISLEESIFENDTLGRTNDEDVKESEMRKVKHMLENSGGKNAEKLQREYKLSGSVNTVDPFFIYNILCIRK